jgi:hypothetical protein
LGANVAPVASPCYSSKREVDVAVEGFARKSEPLAGSIAARISVGSKEKDKNKIKNKVAITFRVDLPGFGFTDIAVWIDGDSFNQLAKAMMEANSNEAIKAFGTALQAGIQ